MGGGHLNPHITRPLTDEQARLLLGLEDKKTFNILDIFSSKEKEHLGPRQPCRLEKSTDSAYFSHTLLARWRGRMKERVTEGAHKL